MALRAARSIDVTVIARAQDALSEFAPYVASLSDSGQVSFWAQLKDGSCDVFLGDGAAFDRVPRANSGRAPCSHPDCNDRGDVVFYARATQSEDSAVEVVRERKHGVVAAGAELAATIGPLGPTMSAASAVAFRAQFEPEDGPPYEAIYCAGAGAEPTLVADTSGAVAAFHGLPVVTDAGGVVYRATERDGTELIVASASGIGEPIASSAEGFADISRFVGASDDGESVAFTARAWDGIGAFVARAGVVDRIAGPDGWDSFRGALVCDDGRHYFYATPSGGSLGLYDGPDPVADRITGIGDPLLGDTVTGFVLNPVSINKRGQLAIRLVLGDDKAIVRFDPR